MAPEYEICERAGGCYPLSSCVRTSLGVTTLVVASRRKKHDGVSARHRSVHAVVAIDRSHASVHTYTHSNI